MREEGWRKCTEIILEGLGGSKVFGEALVKGNPRGIISARFITTSL